jgi:uncharacterized protein YndB with AHSA1/START domain
MQKLRCTTVLFFIIALLHTSQAQTSSKMVINQNAPVKQANQILIQASPEKVWAVLTDINRWTSWNNKITKSQMNNALKAGERFDWTVNGAKIKSTLHTVVPHKILGWSGTTFGGSAIHNWYLEPSDNGTLVKVEESMQGWLVALFKRKMNKDLAKDMLFWLEMLKQESEK